MHRSAWKEYSANFAFTEFLRSWMAHVRHGCIEVDRMA